MTLIHARAHVGDKVVTADGKEVGTVKLVRDDCFKVDVRWAPDYWLASDVVDSTTDGVVQLYITKEALGPAKISDAQMQLSIRQ